jgi:hypothetical protein
VAERSGERLEPGLTLRRYGYALLSKVDRDSPQKLIQTNRGIGYTFTCASAFPSGNRSCPYALRLDRLA